MAASRTATACITTDDPSRYLMQLCKHFRGKTPVEFDRLHGTIDAAGGRCVLDVVDAALRIVVVGPDAATVERLRSMIDKHLAKFDRLNRLDVAWASPTEPLAHPA